MFNSKDGAKTVTTFKEKLFKNEDLAVATRVFHCMELDTAKNKPAAGYFGKKVPVFLIFDAKGKMADEVLLKGYKAKSSTLLKAMIKASKGHGDMPLATFLKKYRGFLNDLDKLEGKKAVFAKKKARLIGGTSQKGKDAKKGKDANKGKKKPTLSKSKQKKLDAEAKDLADKEKDLLAQEQKLLKAVKAYHAASGTFKAAAP